MSFDENRDGKSPCLLAPKLFIRCCILTRAWDNQVYGPFQNLEIGQKSALNRNFLVFFPICSSTGKVRELAIDPRVFFLIYIVFQMVLICWSKSVLVCIMSLFYSFQYYNYIIIYLWFLYQKLAQHNNKMLWSWFVYIYWETIAVKITDTCKSYISETEYFLCRSGKVKYINNGITFKHFKDLYYEQESTILSSTCIILRILLFFSRGGAILKVTHLWLLFILERLYQIQITQVFQQRLIYYVLRIDVTENPCRTLNSPYGNIRLKIKMYDTKHVEKMK